MRKFLIRWFRLDDWRDWYSDLALSATTGLKHWEAEYKDLSTRYDELVVNYKVLRSLKMPPAQCDGPWQKRYVELEAETARETKQLREDYQNTAMENFRLKRELNVYRSMAEAIERVRAQEKANG